MTQALQLTIQERVIDRVLRADKPIAAPWPLHLFNHLPWLRRLPARLIGGLPPRACAHAAAGRVGATVTRAPRWWPLSGGVAARPRA